MPLRRILNAHEEVVYDRLRKACATDGAHVYPKVRIADVIDVSRMASAKLSFALKAHFDFTVVDRDQQPLLVVEFDGPTHTSAIQRRRDEVKDGLCRESQLPLLRVTARHLVAYRGMDLLSWIVDVWFTQRAFDAAQERGTIPWEEGFDPLHAMTMSSGKIEYPFWFAKPVHDAIRALQREHKVLDPIPSLAISRDSDGFYKAIAWLRLPQENAIYTTARMRDHHFPVNLADALEQVAEVELFAKLQQVIDGRCRSLPASVVAASIARFQREHDISRASVIGGFGWDVSRN